MLCYVMLCYVMLCYVMLCYVVMLCYETNTIYSLKDKIINVSAYGSSSRPMLLDQQSL